jgi:hypothetical protein
MREFRAPAKKGRKRKRTPAGKASSALPAPETARRMPADFVHFAGEFDAVLGEFFAATVLETSGENRFFRFAFHCGPPASSTA